MKSVQVERVADGYVVSRHFPSLASAQRALDLLIGINEAAFAPVTTPSFTLDAFGQANKLVGKAVAYDAYPHNPVSQATGD